MFAFQETKFATVSGLDLGLCFSHRMKFTFIPCIGGRMGV